MSLREVLQPGRGHRLGNWGNWAGLQVPKLTFIPLHLVFGGLWALLNSPLDFWWRCWEPWPAKLSLGTFQELIGRPRNTASRSSLWVLGSVCHTSPPPSPHASAFSALLPLKVPQIVFTVIFHCFHFPSPLSFVEYINPTCLDLLCSLLLL